MATDRKERRMSRIENFFSKLLTKKGISDNIFVGEPPIATKTEWQSFVVVDVNQQTDKEAYSTGSASIYLYARPKGELAKKNVALLDQMEAALDAAIAASHDGTHTLVEQWRDAGYDSSRMFHYNIINVRVITTH